MSEVLRGEPDQIEVFLRQLQMIHENYPRAVIVGHVARSAMQSTLNWPDAEPLQVSNNPFGGNPDIDVVFADPDRIYYDQVVGRPHEVDPEFGLNYIERIKGGAVALTRHGIESVLVPASAARRLFRPRIRTLGGVPVRTFSVGVQEQLELLGRSPDEDEKYRLSRQQFGEFVAFTRGVAPDEFPSAEELSPLVEMNRRIARRLESQ